VCDKSSEEDKASRAEGILDWILFDLGQGSVKDVSMVDYGCGEGHLCNQILKEGGLCWGYDIEKQWDENNHLTTDWDKIKDNGPYDIAILYDVLDHDSEPIETLTKIRDVLKPNGKVYVRCHPWVSRHGSHQYYDCNLAYVHLFLMEMGCDLKQPQRVVSLDTYAAWFEDSGFTINEKMRVNDAHEPFFKRLAQRIKLQRDYTDADLFVSFVDYILCSK
jgi:2-polyprenyl-3-methyl-5-hydroxy-6-metoxy-1,4-benzoquinol methylase